MKKVEAFGEVREGLYLLQPLVSKSVFGSSKNVVCFQGGGKSSHVCQPSLSNFIASPLKNIFSFQEARNISDISSNVCLPVFANVILGVTLWHIRLGHLPYSVMKKFDFIKSLSDSSYVCDVCPQARQTRSPFPISEIKTKEIFDLIHIGTWGPYKHSTYNGYKYFLTIVDDYSRGTWTFLLSTKSNAFRVLKCFLSMMERQFNRKVKCIRSDNALELGMGSQEASFLSEQGIIHQRSCVATPQQNGVVDRKHRYLLKIVFSVTGP